MGGQVLKCYFFLVSKVLGIPITYNSRPGPFLTSGCEMMPKVRRRVTSRSICVLDTAIFPVLASGFIRIERPLLLRCTSTPPRTAANTALRLIGFVFESSTTNIVICFFNARIAGGDFSVNGDFGWYIGSEAFLLMAIILMVKMML